MNQSQEINELATALSKAQGEMQSAIKDKINPFFKSKYADLGAVWEAARQSLCKNGLAIVQTTEMMGTEIIMITTLIHSSGQWIKSFLPLILGKKDSQGIGSAITYLRRYSLSAMVGVVCDDDDDGEIACGRGKNETTQKKNQPAITSIQENNQESESIGKKEIIDLTLLLNKLDVENQKLFLDSIKKNFNAESIVDIPKIAFNKCMNSLNVKIKFLKDQEKAIA